MASKRKHEVKGRGKTIDCVIDGCLYLGDAKISRNLELLQSVGITHIVCAAGKAHFQSDITYHLCHFDDKQNSDLLKLLPSIFEFIDEFIMQKDNKIYVHCMAGVWLI